MELDAWTIFAVGGVASLLIERAFYYRLKYSKKKDGEPDTEGNPGYGERIATLEQCEEDNEKDHRLIREDIKKLFTKIDKLRK